ncbi:MAG: histidine kinase [Rhodothermales bacterium]
MPDLAPPLRPMPPIRPLVIFAAWNGVWLVATAQYLLAYAFADVPLEWERIGWNLLIFNLWALATPLILRLVQRYPVGGRQAVPHALVHLGAALAVSVGTTLVYFGLRGAFEAFVGNPYDALAEFKSAQVRTLFLDLIFYTAVAAVLHALSYRQQYLERELRAAQLEGQLAQAQVAALRMQLNPHFLFNTLHAISSLMDDDVKRSRRMLVDLSDLLRLSLDSVGEQEVPLEQELAFLDRYLQIERVRFGDRLTVEIDVDENALDAFVPNLILQPLVENALKHAVAPFAGPGHVAIRARRSGATLRLEVEDDGPGLPITFPSGDGASGDGALPSGDGAPAPGSARGGLGLRNTRERLERLYGDAHHFALRSRPGHGLTISLVVPFHTTPTFVSA